MYERYSDLRDLKGLSDADVARMCNISKSTLSDWKSGKCQKPNAKNLLLIANCLGTTVEYLMTGEEVDEYSDEMAHLISKIRKDTDLSKALIKYFELSEEKRKHIVDTINVLSNM